MNQWYSGSFFWDDLRSLLSLCQYNSTISRNEENYLREVLVIDDLNFTPCLVLQGAFHLIYYRDYTNGYNLTINLLLKNEMEKNQPCEAPSDPFITDKEENRSMNIWGDVI